MTIPPRTVSRSNTVLSVRPREDFVATSTTNDITERALVYLQAGYPVHFRGPSGTGKTTLALHVAAHLERPVILMVGDEEFNTSDLVGGRSGYRYRKVVDRFIHSVLKYEEDAVQQWVDNRLTTACREGFTLVYDEFTRSHPEANNVLLTVLEERLLVLPGLAHNDSYIKVHPNFRAIFTSNPQEYAGVHDVQDALSDRLITIDINYYDRQTEILITAARSNLDEGSVARIVDIVRDFRSSGEYDQTPTMRASIMIARVVAQQGLHPSKHDSRFVRVCLDILGSKKVFPGQQYEQSAEQRKMLMSLIDHYASNETPISSSDTQETQP